MTSSLTWEHRGSLQRGCREEVTHSAPAPSLPSLCCVCVSFHSPGPRTWYKTLGCATESPVLAVLGQDTRGDKPADTGFSAGRARERWESLCLVVL